MTYPKRTALCLALAVSLSALPAGADERESLEHLRATTLELIKLLVQQGVLSQDKADELMHHAQAPAAPAAAPEAAAPAAPAPVVRVPYVPEVVKKEIRDQLREEVVAQARAEHWADPNRFPDWLSRIRFEGDIRIRQQDDIYQHACNTAAGESTGCNLPAALYDSLTGASLNNTTENRHRLRLRVREAMEAKVSDRVDAGLRIATGNLTEPVSTNATLGNSFNRLTLGLDQGYVRYHSGDTVSVVGGRFANPWLYTDLVWSENLAFDGVAATFRPHFGDAARALLTLGAFPVQDVEPTTVSQVRNKWLYGAQVGGSWDFRDRSSVRAALALYDFHNISGVPNATTGDTSQSASAPQFLQKGNSLFNLNALNGSTTPLYGLAAKFRELDFTAMADIATYDPVHVTVTADVVRNIGFNSSEIQTRTLGLATDPELVDANGNPRPLSSRNRGYHLKLGVGTPVVKLPGDWQAFVAYKYLERDAVVDAFTDSDFHLGGTNAKGYILGGSYGLDTDTWFTARYLSADAITGVPLSIDVLQLDLNVRF